uniref:Uncharacterized protein n=1 Tax=Heterorhabditis bacteriophora TaxID=37862 RepID=A0A1I7X0P7_HETBA
MKPSLHIPKIMVTVWWSVRGVVHYSCLRPGQTIIEESYCREIEEVHRKIVQMDTALINRHGLVLLQDNARSLNIGKGTSGDDSFNPKVWASCH